MQFMFIKANIIILLWGEFANTFFILHRAISVTIDVRYVREVPLVFIVNTPRDED